MFKFLPSTGLVLYISQSLLNFGLNAFRFSKFFTSSGRAFQSSTTLSPKLYSLGAVLAGFFVRFHGLIASCAVSPVVLQRCYPVNSLQYFEHLQRGLIFPPPEFSLLPCISLNRFLLSGLLLFLAPFLNLFHCLNVPS